MTGVPSSWDSCTASVEVVDRDCCAVWSPCGQFVAVGYMDKIFIQDSTTLGEISVLRPPYGIQNTPRSITFSHGGYLLACIYNR